MFMFVLFFLMFPRPPISTRTYPLLPSTTLFRARRYRPERVVAAIAAEQPDLICLQEVDRGVKRSQFHDQPEMLADVLGSKLGLAEHVYQMKIGRAHV